MKIIIISLSILCSLLFNDAYAATSTTRKSFKDGSGRSWLVNIWQNTVARNGKGQFSFFIPHSNEVEALESSIDYVNKNGGRVFAIDCEGERNCGNKDPNRMFGDRKYSNSIFNVVFANGLNTAIALHNNENAGELQVFADPRKNGKKFTVRGGLQRHYYFGGDRDDFVLINGRADSPTGKNLQFLKRMEKERINVIYEIYSGANDGSLSYEAVDRGFFYVNLEAEHGHLHRQKEMLQAVMNFLTGR